LEDLIADLGRCDWIIFEVVTAVVSADLFEGVDGCEGHGNVPPKINSFVSNISLGIK
jgi:hypothetical protein